MYKNYVLISLSISAGKNVVTKLSSHLNCTACCIRADFDPRNVAGMACV